MRWRRTDMSGLWISRAVVLDVGKVELLQPMQPSTMTRGLDTHLRRMLFFLMFILFNCNNKYLQLNRLLVRVAITTTTPVAPNNDKRDLTTIQAVAPNNDKRGSRRVCVSGLLSSLYHHRDRDRSSQLE